MKNRSVVEIMVLMFTFVIGFSILAVGATIAIIEIRDPKVDTSRAAQALLSIITAILGALLGLLAGKNGTLQRRPDKLSTLYERQEEEQPE